MKKTFLVAMLVLAVCTLMAAGPVSAKLSEQTLECLECHTEGTMGIAKQWERSSHWNSGVGCYECHKAEKEDKDAMDHNGYTIAIIVSPIDCGRCHEKETAEQQASHHAEAGNIIHSADGLLGQTVGGPPAVTVGCRQCHGSVVITNEDGTLNASTWPNTGIGRINPDGSKGSCSACHTRHRFSKEQARKPEVCGKCHLGPDHPQLEVYEESKHGILYRAFEDELNMDRPRWIAGVDYFDAPTCATCHMSAGGTQGVTHDVGERLSWNLRAPVSKRMDKWGEKRATMKNVCSACHAPDFVNSFYIQLDEFVDLYDTKFAIPAQKIRDVLHEEGVIPKGNFNDEIDWIYWELWHHEGRRARHGAAMSGPDYAWWHGLYEVAKHFYTEYLPTAEELSEKAGKPEVYERIVKEFLETDVRHDWFLKGFDQEKLEEIQRYYQERYQQKVD